MSEQQQVWYDPITPQGQLKSSSQSMAVSEHLKMTHSGQVIKRPQYFKDFHMETWWEQARNWELRLTIWDICSLRLEQFFFCLFISSLEGKGCYSVPLKCKLTGSRSSILDTRNSILDPRFTKTSRIEARVEFRDVQDRSRIYRDRSRIYWVEFRDFRVGKTKDFSRD